MHQFRSNGYIRLENVFKTEALRRQNAPVKEFVIGRKLARIANELLGDSGIRLYYDQAFSKKSGGGYTPWHDDQYYWPRSFSQICTVWNPPLKTQLDVGPLSFCLGSYEFSGGRDLAISDEFEHSLEIALSARRHDHQVSAF